MHRKSSCYKSGVTPRNSSHRTTITCDKPTLSRRKKKDAASYVEFCTTFCAKVSLRVVGSTFLNIMFLSSILLYFAIVGMCWAGEPVCRQFDYDEKMLSKMIRTEIAVEAMTKRLEVLESMLKERDERMQGPHIAEIIRSSSIGKYLYRYIGSVMR